jgi:sphingosine kinase
VADIDIDSEMLHFLGEVRFDIWGVMRILWLRRYKARFSFLKPDKNVSIDSIAMPALSDPVPSNWETMEDDFILFWASNVSHASMNNFQSPNSKLDDGVFQVFIIRSGVSKFRLFQIIIGLQAGTHVNIPGAEFIECVAYRLEPLSPGSYNDIDGEVVEGGPIQAKVSPSSFTVFSPPKK